MDVKTLVFTGGGGLPVANQGEKTNLRGSARVETLVVVRMRVRKAAKSFVRHCNRVRDFQVILGGFIPERQTCILLRRRRKCQEGGEIRR